MRVVCVCFLCGARVTPIFKHPAFSVSLKKNSLSLSLSRPLCAREDDDDDEDKEDKEDETG